MAGPTKGITAIMNPAPMIAQTGIASLVSQGERCCRDVGGWRRAMICPSDHLVPPEAQAL